jgi:hypothetical protein
MKTHASVTIKNKTYPYTLERMKNGAVKMVSKDARIHQEFLAEDVSELILDLPHLIAAEQAYTKGHADVIRLRVWVYEVRPCSLRPCSLLLIMQPILLTASFFFYRGIKLENHH